MGELISFKTDNGPEIAFKRENLIDIAVIIYFSNSLFTTGLKWVTKSPSLSGIITSVIIYGILAYEVVCKPRKYLIRDFIVGYIIIVLLFIITLHLHPEYREVFTREDYGVWDYVLYPTRGIYSYLFVRLINDSERFLRDFKIAGWCSYLFFAYCLYNRFRRGYFVGVSGSDTNAKLSYSVTFGYMVLVFLLVFMYCAFKEKQTVDIIASVLGMGMVLAGGSRGPLIIVGVFLGIYLFREYLSSSQKIIYSLYLVLGVGALLIFYKPLLAVLGVLFQKIGLPSRFLDLMASGDIADNNGRDRIWEAAREMIRQHPFGYGAMGSRKVISEYIAVGYPHSIILEMLIDFGVIIGSILLFFLFVTALRIIFSNRNDKWCYLFIPLFSCSCALFWSMTYWDFTSFWTCIGIGVNCYLTDKKKKGRTTIRIVGT